MLPVLLRDCISLVPRLLTVRTILPGPRLWELFLKVSFCTKVGHLLLSQGDDDSQHVHMPADYDQCTFLADSMDRRHESDTAAHVDRADPVTKIGVLPPQTHAPELQPHFLYPLRPADLGIFAWQKTWCTVSCRKELNHGQFVSQWRTMLHFGTG